jgi:hypothetical protein
MVSSNSMQFWGNIAAEVTDPRDNEQRLVSSNRAQLDDSNTPEIKAFGEDLGKRTGVDGFLEVH